LIDLCVAKSSEGVIDAEGRNSSVPELDLPLEHGISIGLNHRLHHSNQSGVNA
jgi:hypothetical protein